MKNYQCHKIVQAMEIGKIEGARVFDTYDESQFVDVPAGFFEKNNKCNLPGYLVRYEDGYLSWSPKKAFESGYTLILPNPFKCAHGVHIDTESRLHCVKEFNLEQCNQALQLPNLQKTVEAALKRKIKKFLAQA